MEINILGIAGSCVARTMSNISILVDKDILIDCAEGTTQKLLQINDSLDDLERILISHVQADHIMGMVSLLWRLWLVEERKRVLEIIGPTETEKVIEGFLSLTHTPRDAIPYKIKYTELEGEETIDFGEISAIKLVHHIDTFAFRINREKSICYCSDTIPLEKISNFAKDCDLLIHEASMPERMADWAHKYFHSTAVDAAKIATKANIKKLVLIHFMPQMEGRIEILRDEAEKYFKGEIIVPYDMMRIQL